MLTFQPFIGGKTPLYPDYIVFGAFQWVRVMSPFKVLDDDDPVAAWFERCLDLHDGLGRTASRPPETALGKEGGGLYRAATFRNPCKEPTMAIERTFSMIKPDATGAT